MSRRGILVVGAASAIAEAALRLLAARGDALFLVARDADRLEQIVADLRVRGAAQVGSAVLDVRDLAAHAPVIDRAIADLGQLDAVLVAHGTLADQAECERSVDALCREFEINATATLALLTELARRLEAQGHGTLAAITSVAGDRGRASNYVYGAAKAAVTTFLSGLRQRLHGKGVAVVTLKPGFIDTPMTRAFAKGMLWRMPARIAPRLVRALDVGTGTVYLPGFWRAIMAVIRSLPEPVFRRLRL